MFLPPHLWPVAALATVGLFIYLWHYFAKSRKVHDFVDDLTGDKPAEEIQQPPDEAAADETPHERINGSEKS